MLLLRPLVGKYRLLGAISEDVDHVVAAEASAISLILQMSSQVKAGWLPILQLTRCFFTPPWHSQHPNCKIIDHFSIQTHHFSGPLSIISAYIFAIENPQKVDIYVSICSTQRGKRHGGTGRWYCTAYHLSDCAGPVPEQRPVSRKWHDSVTLGPWPPANLCHR